MEKYIVVMEQWIQGRSRSKGGEVCDYTEYIDNSTGYSSTDDEDLRYCY